MGDKIQFVKDQADYQAYFGSNTLFVLYFTASWCGPCQAIKPKVEELYTAFPNVEVVKVDIDNNSALAAEYGISAVPTLNFFHNKNKVYLVRGANIKEIQANFEKLSKLDPNAVRKGNGNGSSGAGNAKKLEVTKQVAKYIPAAGYEILNSSIDYSGFEAFNVLPFNKTQKDTKTLFRLVDNDGKEVKESTVLTDADAQGLIHVPFLNSEKLHSVLLKLKPKDSFVFNADSEIEEDEADELQAPKTIKIWKNLTSTISFDDANTAVNFDHQETVDVAKADANNWYEIKLKFVKFQNVKAITVFIDGEDEDSHTVIDKIVIVGIDGESRAPQTLPTEDEHDH